MRQDSQHKIETSADRAIEAQSIAELVAKNIQNLNGETQENIIIKTGFDDFDAEFGGFMLSEFVVVGARPGMGKTQFLVNMSLNISATLPVLHVNFDLSQFLLTSRFISTISGVPLSPILQHNLNAKQKDRISSMSAELTERKLLVGDNCSDSITNLKSLCKKHIEQDGVQVIIIDYLQLMSSQNKYKNGSRELDVSHICRELKNMARDYNVCVIVASQLNRSVESRCGMKHPQLSDLRESGAIEQDADKVLFIHRPEYYGFTMDENCMPTAGMAKIIVAKNRNGQTGCITIMRDNDFTTFQNIEKELDVSPTPNGRVKQKKFGKAPF